ncbi:hypothetical protein SAY86_021644 [Trapa natans]|uniref:Uncharacterized protein n=1 Tax=Trapa natans TaxID=22666 RepID=A0AAN7MKS6_TRANT|nr:hypothetical protein SAY86_021644 [Trapa natans]
MEIQADSSHQEREGKNRGKNWTGRSKSMAPYYTSQEGVRRQSTHTRQVVQWTQKLGERERGVSESGN